MDPKNQTNPPTPAPSQGKGALEEKKKPFQLPPGAIWLLIGALALGALMVMPDELIKPATDSLTVMLYGSLPTPSPTPAHSPAASGTASAQGLPPDGQVFLQGDGQFRGSSFTFQFFSDRPFPPSLFNDATTMGAVVLTDQMGNQYRLVSIETADAADAPVDSPAGTPNAAAATATPTATAGPNGQAELSEGAIATARPVDAHGAATPYPACTTGPKTRLYDGAYIRIASDGLPIYIRGLPGVDKMELGRLLPGMVAKVNNNPKCADGMTWWKINPVLNNIPSGWVAEGDDEGYWLIPCKMTEEGYCY